MRASSTFGVDLVGYGGGPAREPERSPAPVFVNILMVVIGMLFMLVSIAYLARSQFGDWQSLAADGNGPLSDTWRLWLNTALLGASSAALHWAQRAQRQIRPAVARTRIALAAALALAFVVGQLGVWQDFVAAGYVVAANPANSFFFLITGLHGAHLLVGLIGLAVVTAQAWAGARPSRMGLALCSRYWDFLFVLWLAMFALLASPRESLDAFAAICGLR